MEPNKLVNEITLPEDNEVDYPEDEQAALRECINKYGAKWMAREINKLGKVSITDTTIRNYQNDDARGKQNKVDAVREFVKAVNIKTAAK